VPPEAQTLGETKQRRRQCAGEVGLPASYSGAGQIADLVRIQSDSQRMIGLAKAGVESDQDRVRPTAQLTRNKPQS